jgi:hypothetical protein
MPENETASFALLVGATTYRSPLMPLRKKFRQDLRGATQDKYQEGFS